VRIQIAVPEAHVSKPVLDGALEAVTRLNESMLKKGDTPTDEQLIAQGARWQPEPPGQEHFDNGAEIAKRGHGDCDDWAPLRAARLRVTGEDPGARAVVRKSGPKRWHATVIRSDGAEDDPSLDAGMPGPARAVGALGSWVPVMREQVHGVGTYIATPQLALRPIADRGGEVEAWQARADLPWHWQPSDSPADLAMVTLHRSPVSDQAIVGAVRGAIKLGCASGFADPENIRRLSAIDDAISGASYEELEEEWGPEHASAASAIVGSFFGKAFKKLGKVAKGGLKFVTKNPLGKLATSIIPGAGLATAAFNMASPALRNSVVKQKHVPAAQRQPVAVRQVSTVPRVPARITSPAGSSAQPIVQNFYLGGSAPRPAARPAARAAYPSQPRGVAWPPRK
jgi:hypothetical protein